MKYILVGSSDQGACDVIRTCLHPGYRVHTASDLETCLEMFRKRRYDIAFIEVALLSHLKPEAGSVDYKAALLPFWQAFPAAQIIVLSSQEKIRHAVQAVKAGASDYLTYPIDPNEIRLVVESIDELVRAESELEHLRDSFWQSSSLDIVRTRSAVMQKVLSKVKAVAPTRATVLLTGETGTGKSVFAQLIHQHSTRKDDSFISVHCGAIPESLLESELFGHEKGAFTGAVRRKLGKFEIAHGGTIFLDEIGTITASTQVKLLQVLQERTIQRLGAEEKIEVDVRIIAATNADLRKMRDEGAYRSDLYYRLNVFPIEVPPLTQRIEDMPLLVESFIEGLNKLYPKDIRGIHPEVLKAFQKYSWPGNIRELENLIERAYVIETSSILSPESFPHELFASHPHEAPVPVDISLTLAEVRRTAVEDVERNYLKALLASNQGRINLTAEAAGITTRQLHKLLSKYQIRKEEFRSNSNPTSSSEQSVPR